MSLAGELATMSLADILLWVERGRKTGALHVLRGALEKRIAFASGVIVASWSNDPREYLGQFLVRDRVVTEEDLFRGLLRQEREGRLLGAILVEDGVLTDADLLRVLEEKAEETIYDLFHWTEGKFDFRDGERLEAPFPVHLDVTRVVMEGARRIDEWQRMRAVIPTSEATFRVVGRPQDPLDHDVMVLCGEGKTVSQIAFSLRRTEFDATTLLFDLHERRLLSIERKGSVTDSFETVHRIRRGLDDAQSALSKADYDTALGLYEDVLRIDPLNQHAKMGLVTAFDTRGIARARASVPHDKVPRLRAPLTQLTGEKFDAREGFLLSRVNGEWAVHSLLKVLPMPEEEALLILSRLVERGVVELI